MVLKNLLFVILFSSVITYGNATPDFPPALDDLRTKLKETDSKSEQVDICNNIAFQLLFIDTILCKSYIDTASYISKEINYNPGLARAINIESIHNIFQNRYYEALELNKKALSYCSDEDHFVKGKIYNAIGMAYQRLFVFDKCLENYQKSAFHATECMDTMTTVVATGNIASVHSMEGNREDAKKYFLELGKLSSKHKDQNVQFAFHLRFAEFLEETGSYEESVNYAKKALKNAESLGHNRKIRKVRLLLAMNSTSAGQYELADKQLTNLLDPKIDPDEHTMVRYHHSKSDLELKRKNYLGAVHHANSCLDTIKKYDDFHFHKLGVYQILHKAEQKLGNYEMAYKHLKTLKVWQDSTELKDREEKILELETKYQTENKEFENALLKEQSQSKTVKLQQRTTLALGSILMLTLCLAFLYMFWRNSKKEKLYNELLETKVEERTQRLKKSNEELERFSYIASHDLKEPIRNIKSFTQLLKRKIDFKNTSTDVEEYLNIVEESTDQMYYLVNGILDYTKLGDNSEKELVDLNEILENVKVYLHHLTSLKNVRVISNNLPKIQCNSIQIFQLFKNLIENGLKYNESSERIVEVRSKDEGDFLIIKFIDNGIGIKKEYQEKIFEMFSRLHNREKHVGSGLGLSIVKKISSLMGGEISLGKSDLTGSIFCLKLPK